MHGSNQHISFYILGQYSETIAFGDTFTGVNSNRLNGVYE